MGLNAHLLRMEVIRLGRLEYQPCILAHDILYGDISVSAGTQILEVHIPAGGVPLSENCAGILCCGSFFF